MRGMTKRERQITDEHQIQTILDTAKVLHLGLAVDNEPYVVPMNYGCTWEDGKLVLYLHSAVRGKKLDMIRSNPKVFFEMECDLSPFAGTCPASTGLPILPSWVGAPPPFWRMWKKRSKLCPY